VDLPNLRLLEHFAAIFASRIVPAAPEPADFSLLRFPRTWTGQPTSIFSIGLMNEMKKRSVPA
jgi:hypothetical protein